MFNDFMFHLTILIIIAIITILPANYFLVKYKKNSVIIRNRRDIFKPWIIISSIYLGSVGRINITMIAGIIIGLAWFLIFSTLVHLPTLVKQPEDGEDEGWFYSFNKWLEYPDNKKREE